MEIKNLCKAYGDLPVLENVSFTAGVGVTEMGNHIFHPDILEQHVPSD